MTIIASTRVRLLLGLLCLPLIAAPAQEPGLSLKALDPRTAGGAAAGSSEAILTGRVTDDADKPLLGAVVTAKAKHLAISRSTDAKGKYEIKGLAPGLYKISSTADGYFQPTVRVQELAAGSNEESFTLVPKWPLEASKGADCGPFPSNYRDLIASWHLTVELREEDGRRFEIASVSEPVLQKRTSKQIGCWSVEVWDDAPEYLSGLMTGVIHHGRKWQVTIINSKVFYASYL